MKRLIASYFFFALVCMAIHAQLPRTFMGATLGTTTKHQAILSLLEQKANIEINGEDYLSVKNVTFDGMSFKSMFMKFYDDVLYKVYFDDGEGIDYSKQSELTDKYTSLYSSYKYHFIDSFAEFDDDITSLTISDRCMFFCDMKLEKQEQEDNRKLDREIHPYTSTRISPTVLGCTLGVSTRQQVISAMKSSGCKVMTIKNTDGSDALFFSGSTFEGVFFDYIKCVFYEGKLANMMFFKYQADLEQYDINALHQYFNSLYSAYDKGKMIKKENPDSYIYDDDNIEIAFSKDGMVFSHCDLKEKESRRQKRSLRGKKQ